MKRLLNSSKYWLAVSGFVAMIVMWIVTKDVQLTTYAMLLFGAGILGNTGEDIAKSFSKKEPPLVDNADNVEIKEV